MNIFIETTSDDAKNDIGAVCRILDVISPESKVFLLPPGVKPWHEVFNVELYRDARGVIIRKYPLSSNHT